MDYSGWFGDSVRWYIALVLITWGFAPAVRWLLGGLSDKGASVARPAALLFVLWPTWFLSGSVRLPYTSWGIWITLAIGAAICWGYAWKRKWIERDWIRTLLIVEALSLATFAAYVGLRGFTPQLAYTEKPMDMMFLTASYRTDSIPPVDAWMAGETINYYYLGYLIYGTLSRIAAVSTWVGYNLALATTASMASIAAGGAAWNIIRRGMSPRIAWMAAVLGGFFVVVAGNMRAAVEFVRDPSATWDQGWWGTVGWASSRVIVDGGQGFTETINEFPWFSLLLGDLHPHLTALPFTILAIVLAISARADRQRRATRPRRLGQAGGGRHAGRRALSAQQPRLPDLSGLAGACHCPGWRLDAAHAGEGRGGGRRVAGRVAALHAPVRLLRRGRHQRAAIVAAGPPGGAAAADHHCFL